MSPAGFEPAIPASKRPQADILESATPGIGLVLDTAYQNTDISEILTPWSRVLLEKLASLQLVKKFPAFYGTRRFLTALTSARHLSLS